MDVLRAFHDYKLFWLWPTPFALCCFVLMIWSVLPALRGRMDRGFVWLTRLSWAVFALYGVSGIILALSGQKVASAVATTDARIIDICAKAGISVSGGVTRYCFPPDPQRNLEHWMYTSFCLVSLYLIGRIIAGTLVERRLGLRYLPLVTLFLWGAAYMIWRVAVLPGNG